MKHPPLAPVNTTYRKICSTDYGSLTHTACAKPKGAALLGKTGILSFPFRRKHIMKDCVRSLIPAWHLGTRHSKKSNSCSEVDTEDKKRCYSYAGKLEFMGYI